MWSSAVAGARWPAQVSAASPSVPVSSDARSAASRSGSLPASRPRRGPELVAGGRAQQELARGQHRRHGHGSHAPLVGRVECAQRLDLVPEPLDAQRQRLPGREHVHDAAATGHLAASAHLRHHLVAEVGQGVEHPVLRQPLARPHHHRLSGRADGGSVRWNSAWTLATRTRGRAAGPRRERRDPRRALVPDQLAALPGERGAWLEGHDRCRVAQPRDQLLGHPVGDLRVARHPHQAAIGREGERRREVRLGAVGHARRR